MRKHCYLNFFFLLHGGGGECCDGLLTFALHLEHEGGMGFC